MPPDGNGKACGSLPPPLSSRRLTMASDRGCRTHYSIPRYCCTIIIKKQETAGFGAARALCLTEMWWQCTSPAMKRTGGGREGRCRLFGRSSERSSECFEHHCESLPYCTQELVAWVTGHHHLSHPGGKERELTSQTRRRSRRPRLLPSVLSLAYCGSTASSYPAWYPSHAGCALVRPSESIARVLCDRLKSLPRGGGTYPETWASY